MRPRITLGGLWILQRRGLLKKWWNSLSAKQQKYFKRVTFPRLMKTKIFE